MNGIPIVRLTVERMEHSIIQALSEYELALSDEIKRSVEAYCSPENIQRVVDNAVETSLNNVIREEVDAFYRYGAGRGRIRAAVLERLT